MVVRCRICKGAASMVGDAMDAWGRVDILINNAGILRDKSFTKITVEDFQAGPGGASDGIDVLHQGSLADHAGAELRSNCDDDLTVRTLR